LLTLDDKLFFFYFSDEWVKGFERFSNLRCALFHTEKGGEKPRQSLKQLQKKYKDNFHTYDVVLATHKVNKLKKNI